MDLACVYGHMELADEIATYVDTPPDDARILTRTSAGDGRMLASARESKDSSLVRLVVDVSSCVRLDAPVFVYSCVYAQMLHVCMRVSMFVCLCVLVYVRLCTRVYVCMCVCVRVCMHE